MKQFHLVYKHCTKSATSFKTEKQALCPCSLLAPTLSQHPRGAGGGRSGGCYKTMRKRRQANMEVRIGAHDTEDN
ncbi:hypothetical protein E2C01_003014 [Portunus trituberculatus]|uniref:Uncharacterized protein n=1 Tax=Portunus trituberculatus TaxID=210409 RepID=A0A5B7CLT2_PORTR|nr:hypothetical protein [Portunus trituberculatus]